MSHLVITPPHHARAELKYFLSPAEAADLRERFRGVMRPDPHAKPDGTYIITSLYFDTPTDRSRRGNNGSARCRKKYRIRVYDHSDAFIALECKQKCGDRGWKDVVPLSHAEYDSLLRGDPTPLRDRPEEAAQRAYADMRVHLYRPRAIVEYKREVFLHPIEQVRITFDTLLRGCDRPGDVFSPPPLTPIAPADTVLLEVKYHRFLPTFVHDLLPTDIMPATPNSKYGRTRDLVF